MLRSLSKLRRLGNRSSGLRRHARRLCLERLEDRLVLSGNGLDALGAVSDPTAGDESEQVGPLGLDGSSDTGGGIGTDPDGGGIGGDPGDGGDNQDRSSVTFSGPLQGTVGESLQFTLRFFGGTPGPPQVLPVEINWKDGVVDLVALGEDGDGTEVVLEHTYTEAGDYSIEVSECPTLDACQLVAEHDVTILAGIDPGGPYVVDEGIKIVLNGSSCTEAGSCEWDLDYDGENFDVDATGPTPTFDASTLDGPQEVVIAVRDLGLSSVPAVASVRIEDVGPAVFIQGPLDGVAQQVLTYSSVVIESLPFDPVTFNWQVTLNGVLETTGTGPELDFTPATAGEYNVTLTATDDDGGVGTDTIDVTVVPAPEIVVRGLGEEIADGDDIPSESDGTDFGAVSAPTVHSFQIENTGGSVLLIPSDISILGDDDFTALSQPDKHLLPGEITTFEVEFIPSGPDLRVAEVRIPNNDSDENPYDFTIIGKGGPEIELSGNGSPIINGDNSPSGIDHTDFGSVAVGNELTRVFTIENIGFDDLTVSQIFISGEHKDDFRVVSEPDAIVAPGDSTTFRIAFDPTGGGDRNSTVMFRNNDQDESEFDFAISGFGRLLPDIDVLGEGVFGLTSIVEGDTTPSALDGTDFGTVSVCAGCSDYQTFVIRNTGHADLFLDPRPDWRILYSIPFEFWTPSPPPVDKLAPGESTTFTIGFYGVGQRETTVLVPNNDPDEGPYFRFNIEAVGISPEIEVQAQDGAVIVDGDTTPSALDGTDFLDVPVGDVATRTYTIKNIGSNFLVTQSIFLGQFSSNFTLIDDPTPAIVPVGASASFTLQFKPSSTGQNFTTVFLQNDDLDESWYSFAIQGRGTAPEIDVLGNDRSIADGDNSPSVEDHTDFGGINVAKGAVTRTFVIANSGDADLNLSGNPAVTVDGDHASDFTVTLAPATHLPPASTTTFEVEFDPSGLGLRTATISIPNNDGDENPYTFDIQGMGQQINIQDDPDGSTVLVVAGSDDDENISVQEGSLVVRVKNRETGEVIRKVFDADVDRIEVYALGGNDLVRIGRRIRIPTVIALGAGNDVGIGGSGDDWIDGGPGNDVIRGGRGDDLATGGDGNDVIHGNAGDDALSGGAGDDVLAGGAGWDVAVGGDGRDLVFGGGGQDLVVTNIVNGNTPQLMHEARNLWTNKERTYAERVADARGLFVQNVVRDDEDRDIAIGGFGLDAFFATLGGPKRDLLLSLRPELVLDLNDLA